MEFEHIIVVIAIIWYIVSLLKKKKPRPQTAGKTQKDARTKPGIMSHLGDKIRETVKELERQAAEAQKKKADSGASPGERDPFRTKDEELQWETDFEDEDSEEDAFTRPGRTAPVAAAPDAAQKPEAAVTAVSASPGADSFTPENLRNAIIWSEILAPPLALREERKPID